MRFYTESHQHYCGIDLHARTMYVCVLDAEGQVLLHRNLPCDPDRFLRTIAPYRDDLVVAVECIFTWYWLADLCAREGIPFVLGHALYMRAIHGAKAKNDRIDAQKIAALLKGGLLPQAYVYPAEMRATRDLLRRRLHFVRHRGQLRRRPDGPLRPRHPRSRAQRAAPGPPPRPRQLRAAQDGAGDRRKVPALTILYEIHDIGRFSKVQEFASYNRLVKCQASSAGKVKGTSGAEIGNAHLKWAFSEAAVLFLAQCPEGQTLLAQIERRHGKAKALSILAHRIGRAVYFMLESQRAFDLGRFLRM